MEDVNESSSLSDCLVCFLALFLSGKGNWMGSIPSFPLCNLVSGWDRLNCEVVLLCDNSDFCGEIEKV